MFMRLLSILMVFMFCALPLNGSHVNAQLAQPFEEKVVSVPTVQEGAASGLILHFRPGVLSNGPSTAALQAESRAQILSQTAGAPLTFARPMWGGAYVYRFERVLPLAQARVLAARLASDPSIARVEPDVRFHIASVPNDTSYPDMWHLGAATASNYGIDAPAAWDITTGDPNLVVSVIDTGILKQHPDLIGRFVGGYDFIQNPAVANDGDGRDADAADAGDWCEESSSNSSWHGSHVAGTIAAAANNAYGITGINWKSKILPVRALGKCGGDFSDIAEAIVWSAGVHVDGVPDNPNPARVINMSLGAFVDASCPAGLQSAINTAIGAGAIVVVSAGNDAAATSKYSPANCDGVITVGASERNGHMAYYSNYGPELDISAPGGGDYQIPPTFVNMILSTINSSTRTSDQGEMIIAGYQGTSMASPHISGIISLMLSLKPVMTSGQVLQVLQDTATPYTPEQNCIVDTCGQGGIANAGRAVKAILGDTTITSPTPSEYAYAGKPNGPTQFDIVVHFSTGQAVRPALATTSVRVGNKDAQILNIAGLPGQETVTVMPPSQDSSGLYDLSIVRNGTLYTVPNAVLYGVRPQNDAFETDEDTAKILDVLVNDDNATDLGAVVNSVGQAASGQVSLVNGQVNYQPALNFSGIDTFEYEILNGTSAARATVTVTVNKLNEDPPVINPLTVTQTPVVPFGGVLQFNVSASDPDGNGSFTYGVQYKISGVVQPAPAGVEFWTDTGLFSWAPTEDQISPDPYIFVFTATDEIGLVSAEVEMSVTVTESLKRLYIPLIKREEGIIHYEGITNEGLEVLFDTNGSRTRWSDFELVVLITRTDTCNYDAVRFIPEGSGPIVSGAFSYLYDYGLNGSIELSGMFNVNGEASGNYIATNLRFDAGCDPLNATLTWVASPLP